MLIAEGIQHLTVETPLPRVIKVHQHFDAPQLEDVEGAIHRELTRLGVLSRLTPGMRVALTAGSRGISDIARVLRAVAAEVTRAGGRPFVIPAMGSHGGSTAKGQEELLASLGITEESAGCPIHSSMETVILGHLPNGLAVHMDRHAYEADAIIPINRVKPHTDFKGDIESGLAKICAIGLGKRDGAEAIHSFGTKGLRTLLAPVAQYMVQHSEKFLCGLAVLENAYDRTARVEAIPASEIGGQRERELLNEARSLMASLPFERIDLLIVDEIGKNISGTGMDTNIVGRMFIHGEPEFTHPDITCLVILDLTDASHGNGAGIGLADITTARLARKLDLTATYINGITSGIGGVQRIKLPTIMPTDQAAIGFGLRACGRPDTQNVRAVRIKNTLELSDLWISEALLPEAQAHSRLTVTGSLQAMSFGSKGEIWPQ
ncbi:MAG: nickel-dependent lactate racemase [Chloroflexi bacterium]|nr:nickel-dependent lactate racemase [Chloroflexota bacterium]